MGRTKFYGWEERTEGSWVGRCCGVRDRGVERGRSDEEGAVEGAQRTGQEEQESGEGCDECGRKWRGGQRGVQCWSCGRHVHGVCTGVSSWLRMKSRRWQCRRCGGGSDKAREGGQCVGCRRTLRQGIEALVCEGCGLKSHKKCSGLSRGELEKGRKWRCGPECGVERRKEGANEAQWERRRTVEAGECGVCRTALRRGQEVAVCTGCERLGHKRCTGMNRWQLDRGEEWRCEPYSHRRGSEWREAQGAGSGQV